jgi:hypothetical protein
MRASAVVSLLLATPMHEPSSSSSTAAAAAAGVGVGNPCGLVRRSCQHVSDRATLVRIDADAVEALAESVYSEGFGTKTVDWDDCGWHYVDPDPHGALTAQYVLVLDSLNFCFWPVPGLEYDDLAVSLRDVLKADPTAFSAANLVAMTPATLASWFPRHALPHVDERVDCLHEVGQVLAEDYDGLAWNLVQRCGQSAVKVVRTVLEKFPHFRDTAMYQGRLVHFYKRAQILVGDLWAAHGKPTPASGHPCGFTDIAELTMFADYRVPQILRALDVLRYAPELAALVDGGAELAWGSPAEVEVRAQTVVAVEMLRQALVRKGCPLLTLEVDWLLWQKGEAAKDQILPHHRTLSIYY